MPTLPTIKFTTAAIDNLHHNSSSATATTAFHSTGISIFRHPEFDIPEKILTLSNSDDTKDIRMSLPANYKTVKPTKSGKAEYPTQSILTLRLRLINNYFFI